MVSLAQNASFPLCSKQVAAEKTGVSPSFMGHGEPLKEDQVHQNCPRSCIPYVAHRISSASTAGGTKPNTKKKKKKYNTWMAGPKNSPDSSRLYHKC